MRDAAYPDTSQIPPILIPNPDLSNIPVVRERTFVFNQQPVQPGTDPVTAANDHDKWGIAVGAGQVLAADFGRVSAQPQFGTREIWTLVNPDGGWDHPVHIHFEEGQILQRTGEKLVGPNGVPPWEQGRKDVYRLHPGQSSVKLTMQFRDWGGMFMEHCHNVVHEDHAMLLRWEINDGGEPFLRPLPTPIPKPQGVEFQDPTVLPGA